MYVYHIYIYIYVYHINQFHSISVRILRSFICRMGESGNPVAGIYTLIKSAIFRDTVASRHHEGPMKNPLYIRAVWYWRIQREALNRTPVCREAWVSWTANEESSSTDGRNQNCAGTSDTIWSRWQFSFWLWTKRNSVVFIIKKKTVATITFLSIWK